MRATCRPWRRRSASSAASSSSAATPTSRPGRPSWRPTWPSSRRRAPRATPSGSCASPPTGSASRSRDRAGKEIDRLDEVWSRFKNLKVQDLEGDELLYREMRDRFGRYFPRRHGRAGHPGPAGQLRPRTRRRRALRETIRIGKGQTKARALKRLKVVSAFLNTRNSPDGHGARLHPGDPAGPAADGPARRWPVRHLRPERPVPPGHQPEQPAEEAARPGRAGDHREQREADAPGGRGQRCSTTAAAAVRSPGRATAR